MSDEFVYHYTTTADWDRSVAAGEHLVSGRGMTLQDQGFIHFCEQSQLAAVWQRFWTAETAPVMLLTVDKSKLPTPIVDENTSGGTELFPHLYAPLPVTAVVDVQPVDAEGRPQR